MDNILTSVLIIMIVIIFILWQLILREDNLNHQRKLFKNQGFKLVDISNSHFTYERIYNEDLLMLVYEFENKIWKLYITGKEDGYLLREGNYRNIYILIKLLNDT